MEVTEKVKATISQGLRLKKMNQSELAKKMGMSRSWATRLLNGGLKHLDDDTSDKLMDVLGIQFVRVEDTRKTPELAMRLGENMRGDDDLQDLVAALIRINERKMFHSLPYLPTKDLVEFGKVINRASHENPDKDGKIGRIAMEWLANKLEEMEKK